MATEINKRALTKAAAIEAAAERKAEAQAKAAVRADADALRVPKTPELPLLGVKPSLHQLNVQARNGRVAMRSTAVTATKAAAAAIMQTLSGTGSAADTRMVKRANKAASGQAKAVAAETAG